MEKLHNICIISRPEMCDITTKIQGFLKWIGISYFTVIDQEKDITQYPIFGANGMKLDITVVLNEINISIYTAAPFKKVANIDKTSNKNTSEIVRRIYQCIMNIQSDTVFEKLLSVYEQRGLAVELANVKYSIHIHSDDVMQDYKFQEEIWKEVVKELEKFEKENFSKNREYLKHAIVYSKRKINELCDLLNFAHIYDTEKLLEEAQQIWEYDDNFSEVEVLESKIVLSDSEHYLLSILYLTEGKEKCKVPFIRSFYCYRIGKRQEELGRIESSKLLYEEAWNLNPFNFRALFKLAVYYINRKEYEKANNYLIKLLLIINPYYNSQPTFYSKMLSVIELEYIRKCYQLLAKIGLRMDYGTYYVNHQYERIFTLMDTLDDNFYLKEMYPNKEQRNRVIKFLKHEVELNHWYRHVKRKGETSETVDAKAIRKRGLRDNKYGY